MSALAHTDPATRRVPPLGGLNPTLFGIEVRRMLRNRRTVIFALLFPVGMYFIFANQSYGNDRVGSGNVAAYILVNMALYGAALTAASIGSMVAMERAQGWSRQLRLTPLNPACYILVKAVVALLMGGVVIALVNVIAASQGRAQMPTTVWVGCAAVTVVCTLTFAALGVFVGYIVPGENAMQILGPGLALLSFLGGVFWPLTEGSALWHVATFTPMYGVAMIARSPLTHDLPWYAVVNAVVWCGLFVAGAAWRMSKDTARV
jgi:ABC-2 type transport system permease protein